VDSWIASTTTAEHDSCHRSGKSANVACEVEEGHVDRAVKKGGVWNRCSS